ncbi:MAG: SHOCT domain-containing protein [Deinococcales bacterium]
MMGYGYGLSGFGWIGSLLFLVLLVLGIVYLVRALDLGRSGDRGSKEASRQGDTSGTDSALQILRERYARGEIDREEFEQRRRDLA